MNDTHITNNDLAELFDTSGTVHEPQYTWSMLRKIPPPEYASDADLKIVDYSLDLQDGSDYDRELEAIEIAKTNEDIQHNHLRAIAAVRLGHGRLPMVWIGD